MAQVDANSNVESQPDTITKCIESLNIISDNNNIQVHTEKTAKIFQSNERPIDEELVAKWPSLGHYLINRLETDNAEATILLDTSSNRRWKGLELRDKMLNVASALVDKHNLKPGDSVCISYDHSDLSCILALGVICAGGLVACAYPKDPYAEVLYLARKVEPKLLFCHGRNLNWAQRLSEDLKYQVIGVQMEREEEHTDCENFVDDYLNYECSKSRIGEIPVACKDTKCHVALVTMSSGTTGRPKVVPSSHWNCMAHLCGISARSHGVYFASSASLDYISGRIIILGALYSGYTAVIMNGFEPSLYLESVEKYKISTIFLGAAAFYNLITYKDIDRYDISSVKVVFPMGAKITYVDELRQFFAKHPHIKIVNQGYGTSEICGGSMKKMTPEVYLKDPNNSGCLFGSVQAKLIDRNSGEPLGVNQEGLLYIKGPSVFPGYYDLEASRAIKSGVPTKMVSARKVNKFLENSVECDQWPLVCEPGSFDEDGFYYTGDLAYFNDEEDLFIVGRLNELMSCRCAKKVLPQELEEIIGEHPAVEKVCVLGIANKREPGLHCPRAFIVPKTEYYHHEMELTHCHYEPEEDEDKNLQFVGESRASKLSESKRHRLAIDIMNFLNIQISWEKQLTGGIVILDDIPTAKSNGKVNKAYLRSLTCEQVEIYGDRSG